MFCFISENLLYLIPQIYCGIKYNKFLVPLLNTTAYVVVLSSGTTYVHVCMYNSVLTDITE